MTGVNYPYGKMFNWSIYETSDTPECGDPWGDPLFNCPDTWNPARTRTYSLQSTSTSLASPLTVIIVIKSRPYPATRQLSDLSTIIGIVCFAPFILSNSILITVYNFIWLAVIDLIWLRFFQFDSNSGARIFPDLIHKIWLPLQSCFRESRVGESAQKIIPKQNLGVLQD